MSLKFLSARGSGSTADAISAIDYAITMKANVLSNSWGGGDYSKALEDTFLLAKDKNIIVVTAAGNSGQDISERPMYPAALNLDNMLTVANINESGKLHLSSNYSKDLVHLAAPGTRIFSTYLDNNYASLTGTSMAAPYVSAAAAMLYSRHENISYQAVKQILMNNVKRLASLVKTNKSNGSLDIGAALKSSLGEPPSPPSPPAPPPREGVSFKPELVKIEKNVSKKWYRVHYRVKLALTSAQENLDMIKKVSYYYRRGLTSSRVITSTSHGNSFSVGLKTKYPKQIFKIEITDSQGKVHLIYR